MVVGAGCSGLCGGRGDPGGGIVTIWMGMGDFGGGGSGAGWGGREGLWDGPAAVLGTWKRLRRIRGDSDLGAWGPRTGFPSGGSNAMETGVVVFVWEVCSGDEDPDCGE